MTDLTALYRTYIFNNESLAMKRQQARSASRQAQWDRRIKLNGYAYFVLLFSQLEDHINSQCRRLITRKKSATSWRARRSWDWLQPDEVDRIVFMKRVTLLTEKGATNYNRIHEYYRIRCKIAHGDIATERTIAIPLVFSDIRSLFRQLRA